ncbi:MAG: hypothetical protein MI974_18945 [Chitinophagales bacterium]|nr:hypothetical protein [Chitinophagales bacterium]
MNDINLPSVVSSALRANHLELQNQNGKLFIRKNRNKNKHIQNYWHLSIVLIVIGVLIMLFISIRAGIACIIAGIGLMVATSNLKEREKEAEKKTISIDKEQVEIREGFKSRRIPIIDIAEFRTNVKRTEDIYSGIITIITEHNHAFELLEIFGNDKDVVQNDLIIISNYIVENHINIDSDQPT